MENLIIKQTEITPYVSLNANEGVFVFTGKSYPENVNEFYGEIISYLEKYLENPTLSEDLKIIFKTAKKMLK